MAEYKLVYFDAPGRAEGLRLLFALGKVKFEDKRIKREEWPALKETTPWGQIPILQVGDKTIAQTTTIARFLARRFNLAGNNEFDVTKCEEIVDAGNDLAVELVLKYVFEADPAKKEAQKKNLLESLIPKYFGKFDAIQAKNGGNWLVGSSVTWADLWIANILDAFETHLASSGLLDSYPNLKKVKDSFFALPQIKEYVSKRPSPK